jgi:hypothetical protein
VNISLNKFLNGNTLKIPVGRAKELPSVIIANDFGYSREFSKSLRS